VKSATKERELSEIMEGFNEGFNNDSWIDGRDLEVEVIELDQEVSDKYSLFINQSEDLEKSAFQFVAYGGKRLLAKTISQELMKVTMKTIRGKSSCPVRESHVQAFNTINLLVAKYPELAKGKFNKVASLATKLNSAYGTDNAKKEIADSANFKELSDNCPTKKESQELTAGIALNEQVAELAKGITLDSMIDAFIEYIKTADLRTLTNKEPAKTKKVMSYFVTIDKNNTAEQKAKK